MPLFKINNTKLEPIKKENFQYEKDLQTLTEENLNELFGLKFVATEFQVANLRIDTLAFNEETTSFVIIEYKKGTSYSIIDQGYAYLSLLLNNKAEFVLEYNKKYRTHYGKEDIDFSQTKVIFIAAEFTKYQLKSTEFDDIAFELWKVSKFNNETILYDKLNISENKASIKEINTDSKMKKNVDKQINKYSEKTILRGYPKKIKNLYEKIKMDILEDFNDIDITYTKLYFVFKINNQHLISIEPFKNHMKIYINIELGKLDDNDKRIRDVSNIGHHAIGNYELKIEPDKYDSYFLLGLFKRVYEEKI